MLCVRPENLSSLLAMAALGSRVAGVPVCPGCGQNTKNQENAPTNRTSFSRMAINENGLFIGPAPSAQAAWRSGQGGPTADPTTDPQPIVQDDHSEAATRGGRARQHGARRRGVMETGLQSLRTEHTTGQASPAPFGFRLPATPPVRVLARRLVILSCPQPARPSSIRPKV